MFAVAGLCVFPPSRLFVASKRIYKHEKEFFILSSRE
jgi:hypothetical protein